MKPVVNKTRKRHLRPSTKIGLQGGTKFLRLERVRGDWLLSTGEEEKYWLLWISANADYTQGTAIRLYDNGKIERVTMFEDHEDFFTVKPADGETT